MLDWLRRRGAKESSASGDSGEIVEVNRETRLDDLMHQPLAVVFKHSTACPVSWAAHSQVTRFHNSNPEIPIYLVPVIKERPVSNKIAELTGIRHESPQIIVLRKGKVAHSGSHGAITEARLSEWVAG